MKHMWYPHYYSTYCIHDLHEECRKTCKHCNEPCLCPCHETVERDDFAGGATA